MKIRISTNQLTLRLIDQDFEELRNNGNIITRLNFGKDSMSFLFTIENIDTIDIQLQSSEVKIHFPLSLFKKWLENKKTGYRFELDNMLVIIERDLGRSRPASR